MNSTTNATSPICNNTEYKQAEEMYIQFSYWTEYVIQYMIGVIGIVSNTIAIPVLCSREMKNIFNCLLMCLAVLDNLLIMCQMSEARRKMTNSFMYLEGAYNEAHEHAFVFFLYQFHSFVLCASLYITISLAIERYRAVCNPVEHHINTQGTNPWKKMSISYVLPVVLVSSLFSIPKCFEVKMGSYTQNIYQNDILTGTRNISIAVPSDLRKNKVYVIAWVNVAKLIVHGIIPFVSLSILNYRIYSGMIRRKPFEGSQRSQIQKSIKEANRNQNTNENLKQENSVSQRKANERKQAIVLFIIIFMHLICHIPRFLINLHEFFILDYLRETLAPVKDVQKLCASFPIWALAVTSISQCLLTLNSSSNFYIYCFTSPTFRNVLRRWVLQFRNFFLSICPMFTQLCTSENQRLNLNGDDKMTVALDTIEQN